MKISIKGTKIEKYITIDDVPAGSFFDIDRVLYCKLNEQLILNLSRFSVTKKDMWRMDKCCLLVNHKNININIEYSID